MASHDIVAQRDYLPKLQDITFDDFDDEEETVKMVQLVKTQDPTVSELDIMLGDWHVVAESQQESAGVGKTSEEIEVRSKP